MEKDTPEDMVTKAVSDQDWVVLVPQLTKDLVKIVMRVTLSAERHVFESLAVVGIN